MTNPKCSAFTKAGRHCRRFALNGHHLCASHAGNTARGRGPALKKFPVASKSGYMSVLRLSPEKREALIEELLYGDVALNLDAETQLVRYISASLMVYLQAYEGEPLAKRESALRLLLDSLTATARIVSINAELRQQGSPLEDALHDALRQVEERLKGSAD